METNKKSFFCVLLTVMFVFGLSLTTFNGINAQEEDGSDEPEGESYGTFEIEEAYDASGEEAGEDFCDKEEGSESNLESYNLLNLVFTPVFAAGGANCTVSCQPPISRARRATCRGTATLANGQTVNASAIVTGTELVCSAGSSGVAGKRCSPHNRSRTCQTVRGNGFCHFDLKGIHYDGVASGVGIGCVCR